MLDEPPPQLDEPRPEPKPKRSAPPWLIAVTGLVGIAATVIAFSAQLISKPESSPPTITGYAAGLLLRPLLVLGIFSIFRRFRNGYARTYILFWTFVLTLFGGLATIRKTNEARSSPASSTPSKRSELESTDDSSSQLYTGLFRKTKFDRAASLLPKTPSDLGPSNSPPAPAKMPEGFDFSAGSDRRMIDKVTAAERDSYKAVADAYKQASLARPDDRRIYEERARFFAHFYEEEDSNIESAKDDYDGAFADLRKKFPYSASVAARDLRSANAIVFEAKSNAYRSALPDWNKDERAEFFLLGARAADKLDDTYTELLDSRKSMKEKPSAAAALLEAKALHAQNHDAECVAVLRDPALKEAFPYQRREAMELFFEAGDAKDGASIYSELKEKHPYILKNRAVLEGIVKHGDAATATDANQRLRTLVPRSDPFLRMRFDLLRRFPKLPWNTGDIVRGLLALFLLDLLALSPLLLFASVHYWSLLRARSGLQPGWPDGQWGLRDACLTTSMAMLGLAFSIWYWVLPTVHSPGNGVPAGHEEIPWASIHAAYCVTLTLVAATSLGVKNAWRHLEPGKWSWGLALGRGFLACMLLRVAAGVLSAAFPDQFGLTAVHTLLMTQTQMIVSVSATWGPLVAMASLGLLVPIVEEILFRGVILEAVAGHIAFGPANFIQAALFAAGHGSLWGFPFFLLFGLVNGALARRSRSLVPGIVCHMTNNLLVTAAILTRVHHG